MVDQGPRTPEGEQEHYNQSSKGWQAWNLKIAKENSAQP